MCDIIESGIFSIDVYKFFDVSFAIAIYQFGSEADLCMLLLLQHAMLYYVHVHALFRRAHSCLAKSRK